MNDPTMTWAEHQEFERTYWGDCSNTYDEETKQLVYANRMGLEAVRGPRGQFPAYDLGGRRVADIGGGPVSLLLKCYRGGRSMVVDPCAYPQWTLDRYFAAGIVVARVPGEDFHIEFPDGAYPEQRGFDEAWIYNVLQHTADPQAVIAAARRSARLLRIFEWVGTYITPGHPSSLLPSLLNEWVGGEGTVEELHGEYGCSGTAWYGVFPT